MKEDPDDIRNTAYVIGKKAKRAYINKFLPQGDKAREDASIHVLRLSEVYLIRALVNPANPEKTVKGKTITLDDVLLERRKELFGEGHRMFDAIRNHKRIERTEATKTFPEIADTKHISMLEESMSFDWSYYRVVLPIPKAEINANPNILQNPGYGD